MALTDILKEKILKAGSKQKLDSITKYVNHQSEDIRVTVAIALGMIPSYESGMALIPLLRDKSAMVRATACESAAAIRAKHCEEYIKKLAALLGLILVPCGFFRRRLFLWFILTCYLIKTRLF